MKLLSKALLLSIFVSVSAHAAVGTHNFTISVGGALNTGLNTLSKENQEFGATNQGFLGGGYQIDLGYLYLTGDSLVHGVDTRLSVGQNFTEYTTQNGNKLDLGKDNSFGLNSIYVQVGSTYQLGKRFTKSRLMVDTIGLNLGYFTGNLVSKFTEEGTTFTGKTGTGHSFLLGINLPLGINYIMDNGFMIGFRHRVDFLFGGNKQVFGDEKINGNSSSVSMKEGSYFGTGDNQLDYVDYNITFNIGYVFGK